MVTNTVTLTFADPKLANVTLRAARLACPKQGARTFHLTAFASCNVLSVRAFDNYRYHDMWCLFDRPADRDVDVWVDADALIHAMRDTDTMTFDPVAGTLNVAGTPIPESERWDEMKIRSMTSRKGAVWDAELDPDLRHTLARPRRPYEITLHRLDISTIHPVVDSGYLRDALTALYATTGSREPIEVTGDDTRLPVQLEPMFEKGWRAGGIVLLAQLGTMWNRRD